MTGQLDERPTSGGSRPTVTIAGRRFPMVVLICPPDDEPRDDYDRSLGGSTNRDDFYIPAENGVLFEVVPDDHGTWGLWLCSPVCERVYDPNDSSWIWLPQAVWLVDGRLVTGWRGPSRLARRFWDRAEAEWVVETIDRLSRRPFTQPDGPWVQFVDAIPDRAEVLDA